MHICTFGSHAHLQPFFRNRLAASLFFRSSIFAFVQKIWTDLKSDAYLEEAKPQPAASLVLSPPFSKDGHLKSGSNGRSFRKKKTKNYFGRGWGGGWGGEERGG